MAQTILLPLCIKKLHHMSIYTQMHMHKHTHTHTYTFTTKQPLIGRSSVSMLWWRVIFSDMLS